jgi:putative mRNA 3-end processing factor
MKATSAALLETDDRGLACALGGFHVDPWQPVARAVITHAHGDHAYPGSGEYLCTEGTAAILRRRFLADASIRVVSYGERVRLGDAVVSLHPAGHVIGSAQVRIEAAGETWVVTGDYKRAPDPTCEPFEPLRCDVLITEATFALPIYRWAAPEVPVRQIADFWERARDRGEPALVFCWALGKAQRIGAELLRMGIDRPIHAHGAILGPWEAYRELGVALPEVRSATEAKKSELAGALVLAPPSARGTSWIRRFARAESGFA